MTVDARPGPATTGPATSGPATTGTAGQGLTFAEARRSPCLGCTTSPCCTHLPVHDFTMDTLLDLDEAQFLLNFDGIRLGLAESGRWSVYLARPCRFLGADDGLCRVHETDRQPRVCAGYNPYTCWYRRAFGGPVPDFVWFDAEALARLTDRLVFDDARRIVQVPAWEVLVAEQSPPPSPPSTVLPPGPPDRTTAPDPVPLTLGPTRRSAGGKGEPVPEGPGPLATSPCTGCPAYCCTNLVFSKPTPATLTELDYWRFSLGFPGVTAGIGPDGWSLVVETTCRQLDGGRCSVFGTEERPLRCRYHDEWRCDHRSRLGPTPPADFRRLDLAALDAYLAEVAVEDPVERHRAGHGDDRRLRDASRVVGSTP